MSLFYLLYVVLIIAFSYLYTFMASGLKPKELADNFCLYAKSFNIIYAADIPKYIRTKILIFITKAKLVKK